MRTFLESGICSNLATTMRSMNYGWNDSCSELNASVPFQAMVVYLSLNKSKDMPLAIKLTNINGDFVMAAIVRYIKQSEEGADEGSWHLSLTFDKNDIEKEKMKVVDFMEDRVAYETLKDIAHSKYGFIYTFEARDDKQRLCDGSAQDLICRTINAIKDYMRANVTIDPVLILPGCWTMEASIEADTSVYIGITPAAELKQLIKDDAAIGSIDKIQTIPLQLRPVAAPSTAVAIAA